jgi:hypothetical protein
MPGFINGSRQNHIVGIGFDFFGRERPMNWILNLRGYYRGK